MDVESVQPALVGDELLLEGEGASTKGSTGIPGRERGDRIRRAIAYAVMFLVAALFAIISHIAVRVSRVGRRFRCVSLMPASQCPGV